MSNNTRSVPIIAKSGADESCGAGFWGERNLNYELHCRILSDIRASHNGMTGRLPAVIVEIHLSGLTHCR